MFGDKENTAPIVLQHGSEQHVLSPQKSTRKARSKSMGLSELNDDDTMGQIGRKSPARGILPGESDAERRAARRKSMANRRVSFAPEATLHTWDVIEYMREHTVSTDADTTQGSHRHLENPSSPFDPNPAERFDSSEEESEVSGSEDEDDLSKAMSLDSGDVTQTSTSDPSSTSSSAQLERNLRLAAEIANTRGIEFDEFGDMTMDMAEDEITGAFQPWMQQNQERRGSAVYDQENVDPYRDNKQDEEDISMNITQAVGRIISAPDQTLQSSPFNEITMDFTQVAGGIKNQQSTSARKRTLEEVLASEQSPSRTKKRKSLAQSSDRIEELDEATMDFTQAVGSVKPNARLSADSFDGNEEMSMELTAVLGGINIANAASGAGQQKLSPAASKAPSTPPSRRRTAVRTPDSQGSIVSAGKRSSARLRKEPAPTPDNEVPSSVGSGSGRKRRKTTAHTSQSPTPAKSPRSGDKASSIAKKSLHIEKESTVQQSSPFQQETPQSKQQASRQRQTPEDAQLPNIHHKLPEPESTTPVQQTPAPRQYATPVHQTPEPVQYAAQTTPRSTPGKKSMTDTIKLMTTPRKETLKGISPKKIASAHVSPAKRSMAAKQTPLHLPTQSPSRRLMDEFTSLKPTTPKAGSRVHLQQFLEEAGIRFMDLTTSKRRFTLAHTPAKARADDDVDPENQSITLEDAIVAAACSEPELELYKHACHELTRYIDEGRADMKALEAATYKQTPPLIQAYMSADSGRRSIIDGQMRDIKANARLRSKEMWYGWRSVLVDDLMKVLQGIAEGLLNDDDILLQKEKTLAQKLPPLLQKRTALQRELEELRHSTLAVPEDEKDDLKAAREQLLAMNQQIKVKSTVCHDLKSASSRLEAKVKEMRQSRSAVVGVIEQADERIRAVQTGKTETVSDLQATIASLEKSHGWKIISATTDPSALTMRYKDDVELFFEPTHFLTSSNRPGTKNAPISLSYCGKATISTTQRFFLQYLRASLQMLEQRTTKISSMLAMIGDGWSKALEICESVQGLGIEGHADTSIQSDECLQIITTMLLPTIKTKVKVIFSITVSLSDEFELELEYTSQIKLVYGKSTDLSGLTKHFTEKVEHGSHTWSSGVQYLQTQLLAAE